MVNGYLKAQQSIKPTIFGLKLLEKDFLMKYYKAMK
jgi:hypothetical protein